LKGFIISLTRAKNTIYLFNFAPITPFDNTQFKNSSVIHKPLEFIFISSNNQTHTQEFYEFVKKIILPLSINIKNIEHLQYQEQYTFTNENNDEIVVAFHYNKDGYFRKGQFIKGNQTLWENINKLLHQKCPKTSFEDIQDEWRKKIYEQLYSELIKQNIYFQYIIQKQYQDIIYFFDSNDKELSIDLHYNAEGLITNISAKYLNNTFMWDTLQKIVEKIKNS